MGDGGCSPTPAPSQPTPLFPRAAPARRDVPRLGGTCLAPGCTPGLRDGAGHAAGSSSGPAHVHQSRIGGREQLCCHGGKEAAKRETFPRKEESVGGEGRGLPGSPRLGGINLCRFGGGGTTSASRSMELGDEKLLPSPSLWMVSRRTLLPQPHRLPLLRDTSWAVLSSHLLHKRRLGCKRGNLAPQSNAPRCPQACSCLPPLTRAGLHCSMQITL